jgi:AcrR family transcriptional regulator
MVTRREQAERTRELLLDAAAEELWLHGLGGTRIQDVLDRAQMTKGGLYHHFTSKQEMADALVEQESGRWAVLVDEVVASGARGLGALERFSLAVAEVLGAQIRARAVLRIAEELEDSGVTSVFVVWHDFAIRALQQGIADGEVSDAIAIRESATAVVEAVYGVCACASPMSRQAGAAVRMRGLWSVLGPGLRAAGR